jgi:hypothetical protein
VRRLLAVVGLVSALAAGAEGVALLAPPVPIGPAAAADIVASALVLPNDPPLRAAAPPPPTTLSGGTRIRIARLRIDLPLEPGDLDRDIASQATPSGAAFLMPGTAVPGSGGNAYVYAHARTGMFLTLWDARLGDSVEIVAPSGVVLRYVVTEIHPRVATSDLEFVLPTADERLTLQTSTGPRVTDPRFVVVARPAN